MTTSAAPLPQELPSTASGRRLRLLSYNIQVGISSTKPHHYVTKSWKHVLPASRRFETLDKISHVLRGYDIVALQELDAGSHRTGYVDLTAYLATQAEFPFWYHQLNRNLGRMAQHGNGLLARLRPYRVIEHKLPGIIPGRGALVAEFGDPTAPLAVVLLHLALGRRARIQQLDYISDVVNDYRHAVLMGDLNCVPGGVEMDVLFRRTRLIKPAEARHTYPSWQPNRNIDHILVTSGIRVMACAVLNHTFSDHLPIAMEVEIPTEIAFVP